TSFTDFLDKVPSHVCNKRTIESLIKAGGFDSLGHTRRSLVEVHEEAVDSVIGVKRQEANGQFDLFAGFGGGDEEPGFSVAIHDRTECVQNEKISFERETIGIYDTDPPLNRLDAVTKTE